MKKLLKNVMNVCLMQIALEETKLKLIKDIGVNFKTHHRYFNVCIKTLAKVGLIIKQMISQYFVRMDIADIYAQLVSTITMKNMKDKENMDALNASKFGQMS